MRSHPESGNEQAISIPLPDLGTGGEPVHVSAWFVEPGDTVEAGERILEVVVPGVTCDVCSPASGTIIRLAKAIDAPALPGEVVAWLAPSASTDGLRGQSGLC
ncbi:MAG TPA: lipoyl domain-containing protein [Planctomycetaceae bacterium]|nr:lipoyl domain-containing protein [Planctomycetaceae bacterium]